MNTDTATKIALAAIIILIAVVLGFNLRANTSSQMTIGGDERVHIPGVEVVGTIEIPMDEMIYVPAYPDEDCTPEGRVLIDTPIRIRDTDGTVYWHWIYENGSAAINRSRSR